MFNDRPEVRAVMQYFTSARIAENLGQSGGALAPQRDVQLEWYTNPVDRRLGELLKNATAVRFDGSDQMPGAVGSGSFWKEMTAYVSGTHTLDQAVKAIDASWPK